MKNVKKLLILALALVLVFCAAAFSASAADADYSDAAKHLVALNILKGDGSGNLMLNDGVTRYQAALFFVQALTGKTDAAYWNTQKQSDIFTDVPEYGTAIDYAYAIRLIMGRGKGVYGYNDPITYQDMLVMAVRALGYESEEMPANYPFAYILAAEKLKLTENIASDVANTQALTRGETAQIIWDMLNTVIALRDPKSDKILYPDDIGSIEILSGKSERKKLIDDAGYTQGELSGVILEFNEGESSKDPDTVEVDFSYTDKNDKLRTKTLTVKAADLGITKKTVKDSYLGLPVTVYTDVSEEDFLSDYDAEADKPKASVVYYDLTETTGVKCLGDETIKYDPDAKALTLGGTKFTFAKYVPFVMTFGEDGWEEADTDEFLDAFTFENKKYTKTSSPYGEIRYFTKDLDNDSRDALFICYMPYSFGRYIVRSLYYRPTVTSTSFTLIGTYSSTPFTDMDDNTSYFVEHFLDSDAVAAKMDYPSVSKADGEKSMTVKTVGETVRHKEFFFYYYNTLDNILYVGKNCGASKAGKLTGTSAAKETVKIDGADYEVGFVGGFDAGFPSTYAGLKSRINDCISTQDGSKNINYIKVGDRVVRITKNTEEVSAVVHDYAIITFDHEVLADLLDLDEKDYEKELTSDGWYLKDGKPQVAVLDKSSGKWKLASLGTFEFGKYDAEENEFDVKPVNLPSMIDNVENFGTSVKGYADYKKAVGLLHVKEAAGGLFMIRKNASGVYNLSVEVADCLTYDATKSSGKLNVGLSFSDNNTKTNLLRSDPEASSDGKRATLTASTVIAVINGDGEVGVRKGIQKKKNSIPYVAGDFFSVTDSLIVLRLTSSFDVAAWEGNSAVTADEAYYVALNDMSVESERVDDKYEITVSNLFNLSTMKTVASVKITVDTADEAKTYAFKAGDVLFMNDDGKLTKYSSLAAALGKVVEQRETDGEDFKMITDFAHFDFEDDCSITVTELGLDTAEAVASIKVYAAVLNATTLDIEDYDFSKIALNEEYEDSNDWDANSERLNKDGDKIYSFPIEGMDKVTTVTAPTAGVFDNFMLHALNGKLLVREADAAYFEDEDGNLTAEKVKLTAAAYAYEEKGKVTVYVVFLLTDQPNEPV